MKGFKNILVVSFLFVYGNTVFSRDSITPLHTHDSLTVHKIDSILDSVKELKVGKKITGKDFSENYHYNGADNKIYCIAVYKSDPKQTLTRYYFIKGVLSKVVYQERKKNLKKKKNVYYFSNGRLINKEEDNVL